LLTSEEPDRHGVQHGQSTDTPPSVLSASWEYLMPKRKERMLGYIRESDPTLADSETIRSQAAAVRAYAEKEGYSYSPDHEFKEAVSAYLVPYTQRPVLLDALAACKRGEVDVFVVTEIRAISRKQVEVFVVYDMLQKYNVRLETVQEKFEDSALGRYILATRAMIAEVERENTYMRTQRGKRDRVKNGNLPGHGKPAYGYKFVDTDKEKSARYVLNTTIIYVDEETEEEWSEVSVVIFLFNSVADGISMGTVARTLTAMGIPTPGGDGKFWRPGTILRILRNPIYTGNAVINRFKKVAVKTSNPRAKNGETKRLVPLPEAEHISLPEGTIPAIVSEDVFEMVQMQLALNKQQSIRNNQHRHEELGILRSGYVHCGICGRNMIVRHHNNHRKPEYSCQVRTGGEGILHHHTTSILVKTLDPIAWEKAVEVLTNPALVRERIASLREENKSEVNREDIEATIAAIKKRMGNLIKFAGDATDDDAIEGLKLELKDLERQKREAEALIYDVEEEEEHRQEVEAEIVKFENWIAKVAPKLTDPTYQPTYEEMRLAVRIMGIHAVVFPTTGDYPFRVQVDAQPPRIMAKLTNQHGVEVVSHMIDRRKHSVNAYVVHDRSQESRHLRE
jgi:site-specific DNA recombinase